MEPNKDLLKRYLANVCSEEECELVEAWYSDLNVDKKISPAQLNRVMKGLDRRVYKIPKQDGVIPWRKWSSIAAALVLVVGGIFWIKQQIKPLELVDLDQITAPIEANVKIVLDNQEEYDLSLLKEGDTLNTGKFLIVKSANGQFNYINIQTDEGITYNTVKTAAGGFVNMVLSDGSKMWVNANSSVTYPVSFVGDRRDVKVEGEAYFEIKQLEISGRRVPFYVHSLGHTLQVLGTHFNLNTWNGQYQASLLEGKVSIASQASEMYAAVPDNFSAVLQPGQYFDGHRVIEATDINRFVDWKSGYFEMTDLSMEKVAQKLSQWYGIEIEVSGEMKNKMLYGQVSRDKSLGQVMALIGKVIPIDYQLKENKLNIKARDN
ncbi:FecR family protein [Sphingobacterium paucimobilis]|uniref:FecR protein domain-containing protein n=1 Tax=Sphingobacterium paucimobilis HER1398 TaxID=1346330 RepID=U2HQ82_9SPHI|nr:FecR family protein [Sphingobacterium paucimobilis]ERJ57617.1 hypothetical protein M472_02440 [Sphingobacterium paucimobilis HER1398]